jgi:hypothetical protein
MGLREIREVFRFPKDRPDVPPSNHGWFGPEHADLLYGALTPDTRIVLELGSWLGLSTRFIARNAPNAVVLAVDHWAGSPEHRADPNLCRMLPTLYQTFISSCWDYRDRIVPMRMDTISGMKLLHDHGVSPDLIYIDTSPDYGQVKPDIHHAFALFPDAAIAGDDFLCEGVGRAVREWAQDGYLPAVAKGNVWWKEGPYFSHIEGGVALPRGEKKG